MKKQKINPTWDTEEFAELVNLLASKRNTEFHLNKNKSIVVNINGVMVELFANGKWELIDD